MLWERMERSSTNWDLGALGKCGKVGAEVVNKQ